MKYVQSSGVFIIDFEHRLKRPGTHTCHYCFQKHLGTSSLEEKEDIYFIGIACFSLNQLKLLSMALELMLNMLAHSVSLANILRINYFKCMPVCITKGYAENFLYLKSD